MRKITLLCSAGMSTSLLVTKMQEEAKKAGYECEIAAYSLTSAADVIPGSDIVLLGPQVRFNLAPLQKQYPDSLIDVIDMSAYGMMDGAKVIATVKAALND